MTAGKLSRFTVIYPYILKTCNLLAPVNQTVDSAIDHIDRINRYPVDKY